MFASLQRIMLVQNPKGYLTQDKNMDLALVMEKATFSWSPTDDKNTGQMAENPSQNGKHKSQLPLRNISLTLSKVCCEYILMCASITETL